MNISGVDITLATLRDLAHPLLPQLVKLFTGCLETRKELFNYCLGSCKGVVESTSGHLKGSWSCLWNKLEAAGVGGNPKDYSSMLYFAQYL